MIRAVLYARVSTEVQEEEQTIQSQLAAIRHDAQEQGFRTTPALTYTDEGFSGSQLDRPALDELRDHAREGRFDAVVILCPDRPHTVATRLPNANWKNRAGSNEWSISTLSRMLKREWYVGKARRRLKHDEAFLLRGLVKCGLCGHAYTGFTRKQRLRTGEETFYHFYVCNGRSNRRFGAVGERCPGESIRADDGADEVVWSTVRDLLLDSDALSRELSAWIERSTTTPHGDARLEKAEARLQELTRQRDRLTGAYQVDALPLGLFQPRMDALEESRLAAQHTLAEYGGDRRRRRTQGPSGRVPRSVHHHAKGSRE